jgi:hypothetical protein
VQKLRRGHARAGTTLTVIVFVLVSLQADERNDPNLESFD